MKNIRSTLATVWRIAIPYFNSEDKWAGRGLLAAVIAIELAVVGIDVLINQWNAPLLQRAAGDGLGQFRPRDAGVLCARRDLGRAAVYQLYLNQWLQIRWRRWMTSEYLAEWLHDANHYRMQLQGDAADNPDQRMTDDVKLFVERRSTSAWACSAPSLRWRPLSSSCGDCRAAAPLLLFGIDFAIPGYLVWARADLCHRRHRADAAGSARRWSGSISSSSDTRRISASTWCGCAKTPSRSRCCSGEPAERERLSDRFSRVVEQLVRHHEPHQAADVLHRRAIRRRR